MKRSYAKEKLPEGLNGAVDSVEMHELLEKTRQVGRAMQGRREGTRPDYNKLARLLCEFSTANVYVLSREGQILGYAWVNEYHSEAIASFIEQGYMPESFVERLSQQRETVLSKADGALFDDQAENVTDKTALYVPIYGASERLGTLVLARFASNFSTQDLVLAEYLATLVGIEILHDRSRQIEELARERLVVNMAMKALSYSEIDAINHIITRLKELSAEKNAGFRKENNECEGVVIASKIADHVGVTRSVIVNALRKLESAGIIESRSLGMKGTFIKVLSPLFVEELASKFKRAE
ncbi:MULTISPECIES: GTP-sensing pleiotropic transcriptional regulator CodY [Pyramidobacter]|nr:MULTISPECIES: GTP-sensing pleiotropic transcriptional regulator CodY [Pyramidobacter]MDY3212538.1 GTP-sensing pleiotropic transcriptional regulator CodY [Pyramidobacter sp.]OON87773.1 transcriptional repressor CodY [Pyramidobacter sp. C12-8]RKJ77293.1 GTP-sensing pleiotropic transcriptional regulator CodY [Pyramidobacter sp. CG50-2]WOL41141.1 GTP-sensing pleiotropic transcriptional regulator CodY [Pyramidobacter sp. YE332]